MLLVILLGMAVASLLVLPDLVVTGVRLAQRPVLRWAVAGLGFRLSLGEVLQIGAAGLEVVTVSTIGSLAFGWWIARRLGVSEKLELLLGVGTAICGASAIVAADSVVQAEKRETAVALEPRTLVSWDFGERMGDRAGPPPEPRGKAPSGRETGGC